jgi:hypothetical protein
MMQNNDIELIRDFHHRYKQLSDSSGYALVYDTMALIREFIPCREIGFVIMKASDDPEDVMPASVPLWVATPLMGRTMPLFFTMYPYIPHIQRVAKTIKRQLIDGQRVEALGFDNVTPATNGMFHRFYTEKVKVSDVAHTAGVVNRHQLFASPFTQGYYVAYCCIARDNRQTFSSRDKQLFTHFFNIFLDDFKHKISCPENSPFLPYITAELFCKKTKFEALFTTGTKFKARELATIKACFDLKQNKRDIKRPTVASYLHCHDSDRKNYSTKDLKKVDGWLDNDLKKIKQHILRDFEPDSSEYKQHHEAFALEHITDIFRSYAYFGLYPDSSERFISYLSDRLG